MSVAEEVFAPAKPRLSAVGNTPVPTWQRRYKVLLVVTDVVVVVLALAAAQFVRLGGPDVPAEAASVYYSVLSYTRCSPFTSPRSGLALLAAYRTRSPRIVGAGVEEYRRVFSATLATVGVIAVGTDDLPAGVRPRLSRRRASRSVWSACR